MHSYITKSSLYYDYTSVQQVSALINVVIKR